MLNIMVVDEHVPNVDAYKHVAAAVPDSRVTCYTDHTLAFEDCSLNVPDVVLIDEESADGDPIAFGHRLKQRFGRTKPLIVMMGRERRGLAGDARTHGIDCFVPKPVNMELLAVLLQKALAYHEAQAALARSALR